MLKYINRMMQIPQQSFFLFGPRGSGKTTWVKNTFPKIHTMDLLDESLYQSYLADISLFANELRALEGSAWVFIDEIQRLPNLLNEVHRFIEEKRFNFIMTGSSARKLKKGGINLLAGRALYRTMYPFLPSELGSLFDLQKTLTYGSIPLIWDASDKQESLKAYVQLYLKEEIKAEALVRNLPGFARFLPVAALFHGQVLNISGAARDAEISRTTLNGYIEILEDTLLVFRLPAFETKMKVREKRHPKLYWIDPGLVRAVKNSFGPVHPEEKGVLFEGWLATLLKAYNEHRALFEEFYYWSPASSNLTEVDFILKQGNDYLAIEAKCTNKIHNDHLKGLKAIEGFRGLKKRILIYTGERRMKTQDNIEIWPLAYFLEVIDNKLLWQ